MEDRFGGDKILGRLVMKLLYYLDERKLERRIWKDILEVELRGFGDWFDLGVKEKIWGWLLFIWFGYLDW